MSVERDLVVIEGSSAREVGEVAAMVGAGPVYRLSERVSSFEDAYFELAGTLSRPSSTTPDERST